MHQALVICKVLEEPSLCILKLEEHRQKICLSKGKADMDIMQSNNALNAAVSVDSEVDAHWVTECDR